MGSEAVVGQRGAGGLEAGHGDDSCSDSTSRCIRTPVAGMTRFANLGIVAVSPEEMGPHNDGGALASILEKARQDPPPGFVGESHRGRSAFQDQRTFPASPLRKGGCALSIGFARIPRPTWPGTTASAGRLPTCLSRSPCGGLWLSGAKDGLIQAFGNGSNNL